MPERFYRLKGRTAELLEAQLPPSAANYEDGELDSVWASLTLSLTLTLTLTLTLAPTLTLILTLTPIPNPNQVWASLPELRQLWVPPKIESLLVVSSQSERRQGEGVWHGVAEDLTGNRLHEVAKQLLLLEDSVDNRDVKSSWNTKRAAWIKRTGAMVDFDPKVPPPDPSDDDAAQSAYKGQVTFPQHLILILTLPLTLTYP